ncbi:MAG: hypothetical protein WEC83_00225 [Patescibacteria group bacterium]
MKKALSLIAVLVLVALSSAQYYNPPEQAQAGTGSPGNEVEIIDPSRVQIKDENQPQTMNPGDRIINYGDSDTDDQLQRQTVDEQERLRQEKALRERDRKWIKSVLDNPGMAGDHGWAKKRLNTIDQELVSINKQLNDLAYEMRRGQNKHAKQIKDLDAKVDNIWVSEGAKKFGESLKQGILNELRQEDQSEKEAQEIADNGSWSPLWWWIGIPAALLVVVWLVRKR